jgi:hypothetical protein
MGVVTTAGFFRVQTTPHGRGSSPSTLLLLDPDDPTQLTARRNRRWDRLVARLLACALDGKLARGGSPESSRLLAARAQRLVSPVSRRVLARDWENLVRQAHRLPVMRNPRAPLNRVRVLECEGAVQRMLDGLLAPGPIPVRGVAMASWLLRDGTGPLYNQRRSADLEDALGDATALLDPWVSL